MSSSPPDVSLPAQPLVCRNYAAGIFASGSGATLIVDSPLFGAPIGSLQLSTREDVNSVVEAAHQAWPAWRDTPLRERIEVLLAFRALLLENGQPLARCISLESGKTVSEAFAGLLRGIEVIDFAASLAHSDRGSSLEVARGVSCQYRRAPLGVVAGITPFNFPAMVPMWMFPIALTVGNAFVLKPSEKVPFTAEFLARLAEKAGYPPGVFSVVHGDRHTVEALVEHPHIKALGFVGSTPIAKAVYAAAGAAGKRALCLGGAKNQIIVTPDADPQLTVRAIVDSFTGCAGQRCMAGSLLLAVGDCESLIQEIVGQAASLRPGENLGALIDANARQRLCAAVELAEQQGAKLVLDGRTLGPIGAQEQGHWFGPTILDHVSLDSSCAKSELFGPVLAIVRVATLQQALKVDQQSSFGNATCIFTTNGAVAQTVVEQSTSGMIGVNIGVPVPREPFSFGGTKASKFGHGDITGGSAVDFWTDQRKVTSKWTLQKDANWMS